jgi:hypothetical protein
MSQADSSVDGRATMLRVPQRSLLFRQSMLRNSKCKPTVQKSAKTDQK